MSFSYFFEKHIIHRSLSFLFYTFSVLCINFTVFSFSTGKFDFFCTVKSSSFILVYLYCDTFTIFILSFSVSPSDVSVTPFRVLLSNVKPVSFRE